MRLTRLNIRAPRFGGRRIEGLPREALLNQLHPNPNLRRVLGTCCSFDLWTAFNCTSSGVAALPVGGQAAAHLAAKAMH